MLMDNNNPHIRAKGDDEFERIDFLLFFRRLWCKKFFIIAITCVVAILGLIYSFSKPDLYTAGCTFVPQSSSRQVGGSISSLAAMAGINIGGMSSGTENISPYIYPEILDNVNFKKELIQTPIYTKRFPEGITLLEYYTDPKHEQKSFFSQIVKYTIGLPGVIINAIKGGGKGESESEQTEVEHPDNGVVYLSSLERRVLGVVGGSVSVVLNDRDGFVVISARMNNPEMAAGLASLTFDLLQQYITDLRIEKAKSTLLYLGERLEEAKEDYLQKQEALAKYQDANQGVTSNLYKTKEELLTNDYKLSYLLYQELATQYVQAGLKVKEDTPILTLVKPIVVPNVKSNTSKSTLLIIFIFIGGCLGIASVFGLDYLKQSGVKWPKRWVDSRELIK